MESAELADAVEAAEAADAAQSSLATPVIAPPAATAATEAETLFSATGKLFVFVNQQWDVRGEGKVQVVKGGGGARLVMVRDKSDEKLLEAAIEQEEPLRVSAGSDRSWNFTAVDECEGGTQMRNFAIRFKNSETAAKFKAAHDAVSCDE